MTTSLSRRVALSTATSIALTGLVVAVFAGLLLERLVAEEDAERLGDLAAATAGVEDEEEEDEPEDEAKDARLAAGAHLAIYEGGRLIEGDETLPRVAAGRCMERAGMLVCARAGRRVVAVAGMSLARRARLREQFGIAALVAVLATSLIGAAASFGLSRWSLAPLARLGERVGRVQAGARHADLGAPEGVVEVDALRAALVDAFARLGDALAQSDRFAADAAHELRTPLTTVLGELELLHEDLHAQPVQAAVVARVRATAGRLATLVERLLQMARAASAPAGSETLDAAELVEDVVLELPAAVRGRVRTELAPELRIRGDRALLAALVSNAVENALKFSGDAPVTVRATGERDRVVLEVDDEGPGIPADERDRVFEPFHRGAVARAGSIPGHGVGLALVARVAALHGGRALFAERTHGARLRVELARAPAGA